MQTTTTTDRPPPTSEPDLIATAKRRGGFAAKLAAELESTRRQLKGAHARIADLSDRSGPELADAVVIDDDTEWRRRYSAEGVP